MDTWDAHPPTVAFVNFYFLIPKLPVTRFHIHGGKYSKVNGIFVNMWQGKTAQHWLLRLQNDLNVPKCLTFVC